MSEYTVRSITADEVTPLRVALVHRHDRSAPASYPADDHPGTLHAGGFLDDALVGIATVHPEAMPGGRSTGSWRIRDLAVDHGHRGRGLGGLLLDRCLEHVAESEGRVVWCRAPAGTFGFFKRRGFRRHGEPSTSPRGEPEYLLFAEVAPLDRPWDL